MCEHELHEEPLLNNHFDCTFIKKSCQTICTKKGRKNPFCNGSHSCHDYVPEERPTIVCLCGSTRFKTAFEEANEMETLSGKIVLSVGIFGNWQKRVDPDYQLAEDVKTRLAELHLRKIDMADEVLILNVGGYIGESTKRELAYAEKHHKRIRFLEVHA